MTALTKGSSRKGSGFRLIASVMLLIILIVLSFMFGLPFLAQTVQKSPIQVPKVLNTHSK